MVRYLLVVLLLTGVGLAASRSWQDADVQSISSSERSGAAVMPIGTMMVGVPFPIVTTYYWLATPTISYAVATRGKRLLNLTLHGKTKIAVDGTNLHILDDGGKDVKLPILQKVARPVAP